ncbi:hypothetical protein ABBQ38_004874 [Trebouxia sp. C0009 RCD-2024]
MLAERCRATCNTRVELALCLHSILNLDLYSQGWYAIRLRVQPCAANNDLRITTNAQQAGRAGQNKPEVSYPSQTDELHSEIFLVRFIQQEISLDHTVTLSVEQVADQDSTSVECSLELELLYQPLVHPRYSLLDDTVLMF